jgi:hypothetical protein
MSDKDFSAYKTLQNLGVATGYLEQTEEILWNMSNNTSSSEVADDLDDMLEDLWELQGKASEIEEKIEKNDAEFEW